VDPRPYVKDNEYLPHSPALLSSGHCPRLGWSRNVLLNQIKAGAYERAVTEKKTHNFDLAFKSLPMPIYIDIICAFQLRIRRVLCK